MKRLLLLVLVFTTAACAQILHTPDDFPPPPATVIVEFPYTAEPGFVPFPQPISSEDMANAENFLLMLETSAIAGDTQGIAEKVAYPITVTLNGKKVTLNSAEDFVQNYDQLFNEKLLTMLQNVKQEDLVSGAEGVRVGNGELWLNLFCMDPNCKDKEFLITKINS